MGTIDSCYIFFYEDIKRDVQQWKQDPSSVTFDELPIEKSTTFSDSLKKIASLGVFEQHYIGAITQGSVLKGVALVGDLIKIIPYDSETIITEEVEISKEYNGYILQLYEDRLQNGICMGGY